MNKYKKANRTPKYPSAALLEQLALALQYVDAGDFELAYEAYQQILKHYPDQSEALYYLGLTLYRLGQSDAGLAYMLQAVTKESRTLWHYNLGVAFHQKGHLKEAALHYQKAIELQLDLANAYDSLGGVLLLQGNLTQAIAHYRHALQLRPTWSQAHDNLLLAMQYDSDWQNEEWQRALEAYGATYTDLTQKVHTNTPDPQRRLRVGYVSADLYTHACAWFIEPLWAAHQKLAIEIFVYAGVMQPDGMTARLQTLADHWFSSVEVTDEDLAQRIRQDKIDILVDLGGHTAHNRLPVFTQKPAPVQVSWLGFPGSTGLGAMDYRLSDPWLTEPGRSEYFREVVWNLDRPSHCYAPPTDAPLVNGLPCLTAGYVTFGSFNNLIKATPQTLALWAQVLQAVPKSVLLLKCWQADHPDIREHFISGLGKYNIAPERIEFVGYVPTTQAHLSYYHYVDVALDTYPYNGATTTLEALWMGVPVISLVGNRTCARMGWSFLSAVGLAELATPDPLEYVLQATALALNPPRLVELRQGLRKRMEHSALTDGLGFARAMEYAYRQMWQKWCDTH